MTIILFVIILAILIFVHELGHFLSAKKSGIRVDEFAIGFPPKIFSKKIGETKYSLNMIPFGGFVKIFGEDPNEDAINIDAGEQKKSFYYKHPLIKIFVLSAGVLMNVLFAYILLSIGFIIGLPTGQDNVYFGSLNNEKLIITSVLPESPAEKAGLKAGDNILFLQTKNNSLQNVTRENISDFISSSKGQVTFLVNRNSLTQKIDVFPEEGVVSSKKAVGISTEMIGTLKLPIYKAFLQGFMATKNLLVSITYGIYDFLSGVILFRGDFSQVSGPVGIVSVVGEASRLGIEYLISLTALISLNLAVINLVPFPALDGGRILFVLIEWISRRKISQKFQNGINFLGFALLMILMVFITIKDIAKF